MEGLSMMIILISFILIVASYFYKKDYNDLSNLGHLFFIVLISFWSLLLLSAIHSISYML